MNGHELREAFLAVKDQLQAREDLIQFVHASLKDELVKVRQSVMSNGVDPVDLYASGLIMGLLIKKYLDESVMTADGVVAAVEEHYGMFFRGLREGEGGVGV